MYILSVWCPFLHLIVTILFKLSLIAYKSVIFLFTEKSVFLSKNQRISLTNPDRTADTDLADGARTPMPKGSPTVLHRDLLIGRLLRKKYPVNVSSLSLKSPISYQGRGRLYPFLKIHSVDLQNLQCL